MTLLFPHTPSTVTGTINNPVGNIASLKGTAPGLKLRALGHMLKQPPTKAYTPAPFLTGAASLGAYQTESGSG